MLASYDGGEFLLNLEIPKAVHGSELENTTYLNKVSECQSQELIILEYAELTSIRIRPQL